MSDLVDAPSQSPPQQHLPWWKQWPVWLGFLVSALALGTFIYLFDLTRIAATLARLELWVLLPGALGISLAFRLRSLRWMLLLRPVGRLPYGQVRDVLLTGFMINNVLPARAGELARALVLWKVAGTSRRATLTTVAMERLLDMAVLIGLLSALGMLFDVPDWARGLGTVTSALLCCITAGVAWMAFHHTSLFRLAEAVLFFLPSRVRQGLLGFMSRFVDGTRALRDPRLTAGALLLSVAVWLTEAGVFLLVIHGMGLGLPVWSAAFVLVVSNFGIAAPSAPGHVGTFDAACSGALMALGVSGPEALTTALVIHVLLYSVVTGNGLWAMWRLELKLKDISDGTIAPPRRV